jgi:hypothetical protein
VVRPRRDVVRAMRNVFPPRMDVVKARRNVFPPRRDVVRPRRNVFRARTEYGQDEEERVTSEEVIRPSE